MSESLFHLSKLLSLTDILDNIDAGIIIYDAYGNFKFMNKVMINWRNIPRNEYVKMNVHDFSKVLDICVFDLVIKFKKKISRLQYYRDYQHPTAEEKIRLVTGTPIFDEQGNIQYVITLLQDIQQFHDQYQSLLSEHKVLPGPREGGRKEQPQLIAESPEMKQVLSAVANIASLDSTILADFVTIKMKDKKIIDLGCGNGYIPIFLTLRTKANIIGVEIQEEIANIAKRSVELNKLENQIEIINIDLKELHKQFGPSSFDVVVTNPPYFKYQESSNINESIYQTIARHEVKATLDDVVKEASILLKDGGTFAMVHRAERMVEILSTISKYNLSLKRLRFVYPKTTSKESLAILVEAKKKGGDGGLKVLNPLYVENANGTYTEEILKIFNYKKDEKDASKTKNI